MLPTLFVIITVSFFLVRLAPGGPFDQEQHAAAAGPRQSRPGLRAGSATCAAVCPLSVAAGAGRPGSLVQAARLLGVGADRAPACPSVPRWEALRCCWPSCWVSPWAWRRALWRGRAADYRDRRVRGARGGAAKLSSLARCSRCSSASTCIGCPWAGWEEGSPRYLILPVLTLGLPVAAYVARLTRGEPAGGAAAEPYSYGARAWIG